MPHTQNFERRSRSLAQVGTVWLLAPTTPPIIAAIAQGLGASDRLTLNIQDWVAAAILCLLVPLSIWGAVELEDWLNRTRLSPPALLVLPLAAVSMVGLATQIGREANVLPGLQDDPMSTYNFMRVTWTVLIAYQLKSVWDHVKAEWRKERWRVFVRDLPRFSKGARKAALSRRRKTQALRWRQRLSSGPLLTEEQAKLDIWMDNKGNASAFRRSRPSIGLGAQLLIIGGGLMVGGLLFWLAR